MRSATFFLYSWRPEDKRDCVRVPPAHIVFGRPSGDWNVLRVTHGYLEILAKCFQFRPLDGTCGYDVVKAVDYNGQEKERKADDARIAANCDAPNDISSLFKGFAARTQYGHVPGRQAHEMVFMLRRMVEQATEWPIPIFVMDCDVAATFDHVWHHCIIEALEAMKVPRSRSVRCDNRENGCYLWKEVTWSCCCSRSTVGLLGCPAELRDMARAWNELLEKAVWELRGMKRYGVQLLQIMWGR